MHSMIHPHSALIRLGAAALGPIFQPLLLVAHSTLQVPYFQECFIHRHSVLWTPTFSVVGREAVAIGGDFS